MKAVTSLSPLPAAQATQAACLASWRAAGLDPVSLNHPSEYGALAGYQGLQVVPTAATAYEQFGRHYTKVNAVIDWIEQLGEPALIINADLRLDSNATQMQHLARLSHDGLPYLLQWNVGGEQPAVVEPYGFSAFMFHPDFARLFAPAYLCLGQPWWDYWLPYAFVAADLPVFTPTPPIAYHARHERSWEPAHWRSCASEMARMILPRPNTVTEAACTAFSAKVHRDIACATVHVVFGPEE